MRCSKSKYVAIALLSCALLPSIVGDGWADGPKRIWGNRRLAEEEVRTLLVGLRWDGSDDLRIIKRLQDAYINEGHLFARIYIQRTGNDSTVTLTIDEGEVARFGEIRISGAQAFSEEKVRAVLRLNGGDEYKPRIVNQRIEDLLHQYDDAGYPFVQVWLSDVKLDAERKTVDLTMTIVEGGRKSLAKVEVEGLEKTKESLVVKLSGLKPGEPYDGRKLRESYLRLTASGIFEEVAFPTVRLAPDGQNVETLIQVVEPVRNNSFSAALGYAERQGEQDRVLSGVVRLNLLNIGGSLRDFNVFWRNDGQDRTETRLGFKQRFFFGKRMSFGLTLEQVGQDTLFTWQSLGVESSIPVGRLAGGLIGIDLAAHGDRNTFSTGATSKTLRARLIGGFSYLRGNERRGTLIQLKNLNTYASKDIERRGDIAGEAVQQVIVEVGARGVVDLSESFHFDQELQFKTLESPEDSIPLSEQFYIGGASTLRGYRENQFHGPRVGYARSELLIGRRLENGYLFIDAGYILQETTLADGSRQKKDTFKMGYGFGLRTQSRVGTVDLSFAVGEELSLRQTKVHVILNRNF